jgi:putative transposase
MASNAGEPPAPAGAPHHITQRGNGRQKAFLSGEDRHFYLATLAASCRRYEITVLGYCLMTNHVHLVAIPARPDSMSGGVGGAHRRYTEYFHRRYRRSGRLWQNRFYSCAADRVHLLLALAYVDQNPVRATMVSRATDYGSSSARAHLRREDPSGLLDLAMWGEIDRAKEWADLLEVAADNEQVAALRSATNTGRPWGEEEFLLQLSAETGRDLAGPRRPRGRPPKAATATASNRNCHHLLP